MAQEASSYDSGRIVRIELKNIRGFRELALDLQVDLISGAPSPRAVTVLIGRNGTGKTTLLRALAVALSDLSGRQALMAQPVGRLVRTGEANGRIRIHMALGSGVASSRDVHVARTPDGDLPSLKTRERPVFACAYGAGRSIVGSGTSDGSPLFNVLSLFDYRTALLDPELTLRRLNDYLGSERYDAMLGALKRILELGDDDAIELPTGGGVEIVGPSVGGRMPLVAWADGYRLTLHWLLDLFGRAMQAGAIDDDGHVNAIVLVDELEQHLHPSLQAAMIPRLVEQLPRVQFIVTTHSPLVALGAPPESLVPLRWEGDEVVVETDVPDYRGFSAEDMLLDERLFDTPVYAPETQAQLDRYDELAQDDTAERGLTRGGGDSDAELRQLARTMNAQPLPSHLAARVDEAVAEVERRLGRPKAP